MSFRIGHGFDAHQLAAGRRLVLGGVVIPHARGLQGHSDADVLLHAVADACLGAAGLGDLGRHFPADDPRYRDADSRGLLRRVSVQLQEAGLEVINVDATVVAEAPRLAPHLDAMRGNIGADLSVPVSCVSVKATTTDGMGYCGRQEGIAAHAVVLLRGSRDAGFSGA